MCEALETTRVLFYLGCSTTCTIIILRSDSPMVAVEGSVDARGTPSKPEATSSATLREWLSRFLDSRIVTKTLERLEAEDVFEVADLGLLRGAARQRFELMVPAAVTRSKMDAALDDAGFGSPAAEPSPTTPATEKAMPDWLAEASESLLAELDAEVAAKADTTKPAAVDAGATGGRGKAGRRSSRSSVLATAQTRDASPAARNPAKTTREVTTPAPAPNCSQAPERTSSSFGKMSRQMREDLGLSEEEEDDAVTRSAAPAAIPAAAVAPAMRTAVRGDVEQASSEEVSGRLPASGRARGSTGARDGAKGGFKGAAGAGDGAKEGFKGATGLAPTKGAGGERAERVAGEARGEARRGEGGAREGKGSGRGRGGDDSAEGGGRESGGGDEGRGRGGGGGARGGGGAPTSGAGARGGGKGRCEGRGRGGLAKAAAPTPPPPSAAPARKAPAAAPAAAERSSRLARAIVAATNGSSTTLLGLLDEEPTLLDTPAEAGLFRGRTLLMAAAAKGHAELTRALLARGANASLRDERDATAESLARKQGHAALADVLAAPPAAPPPQRGRKAPAAHPASRKAPATEHASETAEHAQPPPTAARDLREQIEATRARKSAESKGGRESPKGHV